MKKYFDIIIINLLALAIGLILYFYLGKSIEILSMVVATGISISFGIRQYKIENDKIFKELFTGFNEKYDIKFNNILNEIDRKTKNNDQYELAIYEEMKIDEPAIIIDYLNLCAEEYLWHKKGRISKVVWKSWEAGMVYYLNIKSINKYILNEKGQKDSYYGLFNKIGNRIENWN